MPRTEQTEARRRDRAKVAAARTMGLATVAVESVSMRTAGELLNIVKQGHGLAEEATWQALAEYVAQHHGEGGETLGQALRALSECAKMQLLIRSLRRKEGGSLEAERLAAFQALMQEVYGAGANGGEEEDG